MKRALGPGECGFEIVEQNYGLEGDFRERKPERRYDRSLVVLAAVSIVVSALTCAYAAMSRDDKDGFAPQSRELKQIWQPLLKSDNPFILCLSTSAHVSLPNMKLRYDPARSTGLKIGLTSQHEDLRTTPEPQDSAGAATAMGAFRLGQFLGEKAQQMVLTQDPDSLDAPIGENAVVLGMPDSRYSFGAGADIQFAFAGDAIENLHPAKGEARFLSDSLESYNSGPETHALISMLPAPDAAGVRLFLTAKTSIGILAAVEAVTNPGVTDQVFAKLKGPTGDLPRYFQVVITARSIDHLFPADISYASHKIVTETASAQ